MTSMLSRFLIAAALLASPVLAAEDAAIRAGQVVRDANDIRLGPVDRADAAGVRVIFNARIVLIPADTITVTDGKVKTSLTRKDVAKLK